MIHKDDVDFKIYRIAVVDFVKLLEISDKDFYRKVKVWSRKLVSSLLIFKGDGENELQITWLSSAEYKASEGVVELEFSPKLKPFLLQLKTHFTPYELENIIRLKRTYSIRIYELLKQYQSIGKRRFILEDLRKILTLYDGEYKGFKSFKRWVLLPAQKELEEKTDISFTWNEEKKWRDVIAIEFIITPQAMTKNICSSDALIKNTETQKEKLDNTFIEPHLKDNKSSLLVDLLVTVGVSQQTAENLVKEHPEERIKAAIIYTQAQQKEGKVKNPGGFVVEAIKNEYRDNQAEERNKKEKSMQETKAREDHIKKFEQLKNIYSEAKNAMFEIWISNQSEDALIEYRKQFLETVEPMFRKSKSIVEKLFYAHLKALVQFPSLREWAKQGSLDISLFEKELAQEERQAGVMVASPGIAA